MLAGDEGFGNAEEHMQFAGEMRQRIKDYATDESGLLPGAEVWNWNASKSAKIDHIAQEAGSYVKMVDGKGPRLGQRIVYVDGGFDLFSSGHIEFLRQVMQSEQSIGRKNGWYEDEATKTRVADYGEDFGPAYVVGGIHDDEVINYWKGVNYPIMNIFERGLCVLQCKVSLYWFRSLLPLLNIISTFMLSYSLPRLPLQNHI